MCTIDDLTGGGSSSGSGDGDDDNDDDDDDKSSTTTCATMTTTSNCDVWCSIATESAVATTDCTSTTCYAVTACHPTVTTHTFTTAATDACPTVATGADLSLNIDSFGGCEPCAWHYIPFYSEEDETYEDNWPILYQSDFAWPSIDLKRRGIDQDMPQATGTAMNSATDPMITPMPTHPATGDRYGAALGKREGAERETIKKVGACTIGADTTVTAPPYTNGYDWFNSFSAGKIEGSQTLMPRWFHSTTAGVCTATVTMESNLANLPDNYNDGATMDHACKCSHPFHPDIPTLTWLTFILGEMGWLKDFFSSMFTGKDTSTFSCDQAEEIFFGCGGTRLQSVS